MISADAKFAQADVVVSGFNGDSSGLWNFVSGKDSKESEESSGFFGFFKNIFSKIFGGVEEGSRVGPLNTEHNKSKHGPKSTRYNPRRNNNNNNQQYYYPTGNNNNNQGYNPRGNYNNNNQGYPGNNQYNGNGSQGRIVGY